MPESDAQSTFIGVAICLCANVVISLALNCQKLAHVRIQQDGEHDADQGATSSRSRQGTEYQSDSELENGGDGGDAGGARDVLGVVVVMERERAKRTAQREHLPLLAPTNAENGSGTLDYGSSGSQGGTQTSSERSSPNESRSRSSASPTKPRKKRRSDSSDVDAQPHCEHDHDQQGPTTDYLRSKLWWLGMGLMVLGESGNFLSYGFAPASLVAPLGAVALLSNVIISPILLHERFRPSDLIGIAFAILGSVTVVFASKDRDVRLGPDQLWDAMKRLEFVIYSAIACGSGALLAWLSTTRWADKLVLIDVGVCAIFGGFTVLSTKSLSGLLSGGPPFELLKYPITYGLIAVLAGTAVLQLTYLNRALQRFDSREVIPSQYVLFTLSAITGAAILFRDFEDVDAHRLINFLFGVLCLFSGVFLLTRQSSDAQQTDEEVQSEQQHAGDQPTFVNSVAPDQAALLLPTVQEDGDDAERPAHVQYATPLAAARGRPVRPSLVGAATTGTNLPAISSSAGLFGTSFTSISGGLAGNAARTPRRSIVGLAPASASLSQGTYLLLAAGTSPSAAGLAQARQAPSTVRPRRSRSLSQPSTPTRSRSARSSLGPHAIHGLAARDSTSSATEQSGSRRTSGDLGGATPRPVSYIDRTGTAREDQSDAGNLTEE
ncbi:Uncharacterized conserved protein [Ceraceosorus bombacis]|uniref:Uncharacterized conserved protein n=1 Tax=Ceraceosorus bombacis TaxID=401625 RepID=A0A0P1BAN1_9BASI|nr:Uncharacterized conserved protein [Ceraceosorus bombacis]